MSKCPNWTEQELKILVDNYPKLGRSSALQNLFKNRSIEAICLKANRLGLKVANNIRKGRTNDEYLSLVEQTNFIPLEEYKGSTVPILHMCGLCDHEWYVRPQHILKKGAKCPVCDLTSRKLHTNIVDSTLTCAGFERLSDYKGSLQTLTLKHISCGYIWDTTYSYIEQGSGCPLCNIGFGYKLNKSNMPEKASIYLFKIKTKTEEYFKLGITSRNLNKRKNELTSYIPELIHLELVHAIESSGINTLKKEAFILKKYKQYNSTTKFAGSTELLHISNDIDAIKKDMSNDNV